MSAEMYNAPMSDAELAEKADAIRKEAKSSKYMLVGGFCACFFGILLMPLLGSGAAAAFIAGIVLAVIGGTQYSKYHRQLKSLIGTNLVYSALCDVFDNVEYRMFSRLSDNVVKHTSMGLPFSFDEIEGSDYVSASYKGIKFERSDITLVSVTHTTDSKGHTKTTRTTVFKGQWMVCDFGKPVSCDILVSERTGLGKVFKLGGIKTESEEFNKHFNIRSDSEHDVFYILTPHMMEAILELDARVGGGTYLRFDKNGKLYAAMNTGKDSFEFSSTKSEDFPTLRAQFAYEANLVTDVMNVLELSDTMYARRAANAYTYSI